MKMEWWGENRSEDVSGLQNRICKAVKASLHDPLVGEIQLDTPSLHSPHVICQF